MRQFLLLTIGSFLSLSGCARGFNRELLESRLRNEPAEVSDVDIKNVQGLKPQLPVPFKVAVYLDDSSEWKEDLRMKIAGWG